MRRRALLLAGALAVATMGAAANESVGILDPDAVVSQLRELPTLINLGPMNWACSGSGDCPPPPLPPLEAKRHQIYEVLFSLGPAAVAALARGLSSSDIQLRRNITVAFDALGGGWWFHDRQPSSIDISAALPALMAALDDPDKDVRGFAADDLGYMGSAAAPAVDKLVKLLKDPEEGVRNNACLGLKGIGPAAIAALPVVRKHGCGIFTDVVIGSLEGRLLTQ